MYGFSAKAVTPSSKPNGIATKNPSNILNQYGFIYGHILDNNQPYLNEFFAVVISSFIYLHQSFLIYSVSFIVTKISFILTFSFIFTIILR